MTAVQLTFLPAEDPAAGMCKTRVSKRWPLAALLDAEGIDRTSGSWAASAAIRFGVSRRTVHRWAAVGLTTVQADRVAIRAGLHPAIVWSAWLL